jgi:hypothetical protein|tara:strand:- start:761 stop:1183 length:423 start_codon:yes stop_codon:yes gene_type:complete
MTKRNLNLTPEQRKKKNDYHRKWYHKNKKRLTKEKTASNKAKARINSLRYVAKNKTKYLANIIAWKKKNAAYVKKYMHDRYMRLRGPPKPRRRKLIKDLKLDLNTKEKIKYNFNCVPIRNLVIQEKAIGTIENKKIIIEW